MAPSACDSASPAGWAEAGARGTTGYELIAYIDGALTNRAGFFHLEAARQQLSDRRHGARPAGRAGSSTGSPPSSR